MNTICGVQLFQTLCLFIGCRTIPHKHNLCHLIALLVVWLGIPLNIRKTEQPLSASAVLSPEVVCLNIAYHMSHSMGMAGMCQ